MRKRDRCEHCRFCDRQPVGKAFIRGNTVTRQIRHFCTINDTDKEGKAIPTTVDKCAKCKRFKSKYIEFPIQVNSIDHSMTDTMEYRDTYLFGQKYGKGFNVTLRLASGTDNKDYDGHFVGECPTGIITSYSKKRKKLILKPLSNPAFWVPELKRLVFGYECWWAHKGNANKETNSCK